MATVVKSRVSREEWESPDLTLEGEITHHGLAEIFQFLEVGNKSGLLSVEDQKPVGLVQFENGNITFAQTYFQAGYEAVLEILSREGGWFRFYSEKETLVENCRLAVTPVLMHWAKRVDEFGCAQGKN
jgi:hypothetical protein